MAMFEVDDTFLQSVGYDTNLMSEQQKTEVRTRFLEELHLRSGEEITHRLSDEDAEEMREVGDNPERARRWLQEFHSDYRDRDEFKNIAAGAENDDEAVTFYAVALWLNYAVPDYGEIMKEVMRDYHETLIQRRDMARAALGAR